MESPALVAALTRPLPGVRAGLASAWYSAFAAGSVTGAEAAVGAGRHDEPGELESVFSGWRRDGVASVELVLPVPGDVRGLPAQPDLAAAALEAGEAVVTRGAAARSAWVPTVSVRGPAGDTVSLCSWEAFPVGVSELLAAPVLTVTEAASDLRDALGDATRELARLEVARWEPEIAAPLAQLREDIRRGRGPANDLPPGHPRAARDLLERADPLARVLQLAEATPGMAVTGAEVAGRAGALRALASAVRRARMAAYNGA